jgi:glycosyltransferase involved in cell wall biosynthesis
MKRLSILIPMYNVEHYVERCLRSLEDQDIPGEDYEIICINDGSPDDSRGVVKRLQGEFDNILLIDQENQGVSAARNKAMDMASGKYLFMMDPDDYLQSNVLKERLDIMDKNDLELGSAGYVILDEDMKEEYRYDPAFDSDQVISGIELYRLKNGDYKVYQGDPHRSVSFFIRASFLNDHGLRYLSGVPFLEDGELMARILCLAERTTVMHNPVYMRTTRPGSATHSNLFNSERARKGFLKAAHNLYEFKRDFCRNEVQTGFINQFIVHFTIISIASIELSRYLSNYSSLYRALKKGPLRTLDTEGVSEKYAKWGRSYNRSIHNFYLRWKLTHFSNALRWRIEDLFR